MGLVALSMPARVYEDQLTLRTQGIDIAEFAPILLAAKAAVEQDKWIALSHYLIVDQQAVVARVWHSLPANSIGGPDDDLNAMILPDVRDVDAWRTPGPLGCDAPNASPWPKGDASSIAMLEGKFFRRSRMQRRLYCFVAGCDVLI